MSNPYITFCHNFNSWIYKGQCCQVCCEKAKCHKNLNFQLPDGIAKLNILKIKDKIPMGNYESITFDLNQLFTTMVTAGIPPEKPITEYSEQEIQDLGRCYFASQETINDSEEIPF